MRVVRPGFSVKIDRRIPRIIRRRRRLVLLAEALETRPGPSIVPSTVKCSSESKPASRASTRTASKKAAATSLLSNRSRFFVNTVGSQIGSSIPKPTNQRYRTLYSIPSINSRSLRMV
jgi:hypothetical protein